MKGALYMDRMMDPSEDMCSVTDPTAFDPTSDTRYTSRKDRKDVKAKNAQGDIGPMPLEEGFTRIGPARYRNMDDDLPSETPILEIRTPIRRMNSDQRRPHRAQPTRRACNAH
jgi:hypothetical protein